jgi:hypothetical protein
LVLGWYRGFVSGGFVYKLAEPRTQQGNFSTRRKKQNDDDSPSLENVYEAKINHDESNIVPTMTPRPYGAKGLSKRPSLTRQEFPGS